MAAGNYTVAPATTQQGLVAVSVGDGTGSFQWVPATSLVVTIPAKTWYDNHIYSVSGTLAVPSGTGSVPNVGPTAFLPPFPYVFPAASTVTLVAVRYFCRSGTATMTCYQNGSAIAALTGLSVSSTPTTTTCSVAVTSNDLFQPYLSAVSSADGLTVDFVFSVTE
jgi:hypothetical protein